jgi:hypothetical protein
MSRTLVSGSASGTALVLDEPLSMWGGLDPETGEIIDRRHPQSGEGVTGTILVLPHGRGSSSSASVLAEAIRVGTAPSAIVLAHADDIILLGALVAEAIYGITCPIVLADAQEYDTLTTGMALTIHPDGRIEAAAE